MNSEDNQNFPTGGFPPILICSKATLEIIQQNKNREYIGNKKSVSIKDIMGTRSKTPFI